MNISRSGPLQEALRRMRSMLLAPQIVLMVAGIVLAFVLIFVGELAALRALDIHTNGSTLAFIMGFIIATFLCAILYIAIVFTGAANYLTGALAERWTRQEFAALGSAWHIFSNVPFSIGYGDMSYEIDVDHIVVGPYGVLVLETKYSSSPVDLGAVQLEKRVNEAMNQVEDNVGRVRALLHQIAPGVPIRPVVIFWGRLVSSAATPVRRVSGRHGVVRIVHGGDAKEWRPKLTEKAILPAKDIEGISVRIEAYLSEMNLKMGHGHSRDSKK
jgi:Nuclease-related domain